MGMSLADFEVAPYRNGLSAAQQRRLNRKHCTGSFGKGSPETIRTLIRDGYVNDDGQLTEKATHYIFHYGPLMPI